MSPSTCGPTRPPESESICLHEGYMKIQVQSWQTWNQTGTTHSSFNSHHSTSCFLSADIHPHAVLSLLSGVVAPFIHTSVVSVSLRRHLTRRMRMDNLSRNDSALPDTGQNIPLVHETRLFTYEPSRPSQFVCSRWSEFRRWNPNEPSV